MKLIVADDHDLVRDALSILIERDAPDATLLGASDYYQALELAQTHSDVDLILLDVYMPGMDKLLAVQSFVSKFPNVPVIMMSGLIQKGDVQRSFEMGAKGFIPKTMNGKTLISVINLVLSGARYVPDIMLSGQQEQSIADPQNAALSGRESDVLQQLIKGLSNKVIARKLDIEETTVKLHLRSLFKKLEVTNRTEAVIKAIEMGLASKS